MISSSQFRKNFALGLPVSIAIVGDSTTCGFGANPGPNVWSDGNSYIFVNGGTGPNWESGDPYYINTSGMPSQAQQDNKAIPSATRLLRTYVEAANPQSKVYNFGGSGWTAANHISNGSIAALAAMSPKPEVVFIALGINSAKNNQGQGNELRTLLSQAIANDMLPVLVKEHNVAVAGSPSGNWSATATADNWYPMDNWPGIRSEIDSVAQQYGVGVIDLGTEDCVIDSSLLYDPFHPSAKGYQVIFEKFKNWISYKVVKIHNSQTGFSIVPSGPVRIKTSDDIVCLGLTNYDYLSLLHKLI